MLRKADIQHPNQTQCYVQRINLLKSLARVKKIAGLVDNFEDSEYFYCVQKIVTA